MEMVLKIKSGYYIIFSLGLDLITPNDLLCMNQPLTDSKAAFRLNSRLNLKEILTQKKNLGIFTVLSVNMNPTT